MASFSGAKSPSLHPLTRGCKEVTTEKAGHRLKKEGETEILTPLTGVGVRLKPVSLVLRITDRQR